MDDSDHTNSAKGRTSFDIATGNTLVHFFNRNVTPYATESGGPKFDLIPVEKQKDIMINHARMYAQQEYDRIMELVSVLEKQAQAIKRRLDVTMLCMPQSTIFKLSWATAIGWCGTDGMKKICWCSMDPRTGAPVFQRITNT
jgi:hypothetical protein